jgi:hypothetical protein
LKVVDGVGVHEAAEADDKGSVPEIIGMGERERERGRERERERERVGRGVDSLWLWRLLLGRGWRRTGRRT